MSDIDFDELDKAVNTLMSDVPKVEPTKTEDIKTLTIESTLTDDSRPSFAKLDSTLTEVNKPAVQSTDMPTTIPTRTSTPPLAARRGGRFMDVVHPSSDMKTAAQAVRPASRQGVTIEPMAAVSAPASIDEGTDTPAVDDTVVHDTYDGATASNVADVLQNDTIGAVVRDAPANDWPDPLEMSGYEPESKPELKNEQASDVEVDEPTNVVNDGTDLSSVDELQYEDPQPLTSPFITDAKVEKRPLGGASVEEPGRAPVLGALAADDDMTSAADPADQLPATPANVEVQLPPELQSDLMAIETDGDMTVANTASQEASVDVTDIQPVAETSASPAVAESAQEAKASANATAHPGPTSIPQQYHEAPSTSDESNGSIYDTASYHQPLAHPAKTKSGWLWVIWILLLLIVGGGGAVALYFIGII